MSKQSKNATPVAAIKEGDLAGLNNVQKIELLLKRDTTHCNYTAKLESLLSQIDEEADREAARAIAKEKVYVEMLDSLFPDWRSPEAWQRLDEADEPDEPETSEPHKEAEEAEETGEAEEAD